MEEYKQNLEDQVLGAIKRGKLCMRPRWQFVLRGALAVLGGVLIGLLLLYLISLIIFVSRQSGAAFGPMFGLRGLAVFLRALPWLLISLSIIFVILLEVLVRRYAFAYRRPLIFSAAGIFALVVVGGFVVAGTSFHRQIMVRAQMHQLPFGEGFYREIGEFEPPHIYRGAITATTTDGFRIRGRRGNEFLISRGVLTRVPPDWSPEAGQSVVVFGDAASGTVEAFGIRLIAE